MREKSKTLHGLNHAGFKNQEHVDGRDQQEQYSQPIINYKQPYTDKQPLTVDAYLKQVLKVCNTYENSDGLTADDERLLSDWPTLPVKQKFRGRAAR